MALRPTNQGEQLESAQLVQLIEASVAGIYDPNGKRYILTCLKGEFQPDEEWESFRPDGFHEDAWNALSKEHRVYTAQIRWDHAQAHVLHRLTYGAPVTSLATPGIIQEIFVLRAHDARELIPFTLERGTPNNCERCTYALLVSISREADRDGQVTGNLVILCRKPSATGVPMTGLVPQNTKYQLNAANVTDAVELNVLVPGQAVQSVIYTPGESEATFEGALAALDGIETAEVTGTIAESVGETHHLLANGAKADALVYGTVAVSPVVTAAALQVTSRAKGGIFTDVVVTEPLSLRASLVGSPDGLLDGDYIVGVNVNGKPSFTFGTKTIKFSGDYWGIYDSEVSEFGGLLFNGGGGENLAYPWLVGTWSHPFGYYTTNIDVTYDRELQWAFPLGVGNVPDITEAPGAGWSTMVTPAGNATGSLTFEITAPAGVQIEVSVEEGDGYSVSLLQRGSTGRLAIPSKLPVMGQHFSVRLADTREELDTAPVYGKVKIASWALENLVEAVWFAQEGETSYTSHADSDERTNTQTIRAAVASVIHDALMTYKAQNPSKEFWLEIRDNALDGKHLNRYQFHSSVAAAANRMAAGKVSSREFTARTVLDNEPLNANPLTDGGASMYVVSSRAA